MQFSFPPTNSLSFRMYKTVRSTADAKVLRLLSQR